ncbi:sugar phosphate isomerase/epimerase family protein [Chitinophaga niabensis]|uniref:D-psicose/D-tagatose/L-ribulose 3-epimerase n=1 Tax=Chitinophaga niabensis TaxID=536979 RepID=A0A1N6DJ02_9BACT|nr:sugar phosphate isomerase/epimerase family protein [Chitinophaga niabensis]SIN70697.1 D-psicose/D-tagatose/L-ribulose 3-epimerase [Chitinophaga niabensis]
MALPVRFGVSTWLWTSPFSTASIHELFPKIASMGFDVVEIAVEDPALIDVKAVQEALVKYNLKANICGAFGPSRDLTHEDPAVHQNCFTYIAACLDICVALGTDFFGGPMYSAVGKARMIPPEQRKKEWDLAVQNLRIVCDMAAARGLSIALEPLNRFESDLVNTTEDVLRLVKDIQHPAAGIMLDGFHMSIEERDVEQAILAAGDKLIHLQVSENYRGTPGTGQTPWLAYRKGLEAINYTGTVTIESFTPANQELAGAVCFWHPMAESQDGFATEGLRFLKDWAK